MCGIAGIVASPNGPPPRREYLEAMGRSLAHRGPDEHVVEVEDGVGFSVRRLAIMDPEGGHQPYRSEDGRIRAVFNGEIYNYKELRHRLERLGHRFSSSTDGEVIVHLWEEEGPDFLGSLSGMFGIALHDAKERLLFIARDGMGIKPLYYSLDRGKLLFASEIKALLAGGLSDRSLDLDAVGQLFSWEYVPAPKTLLAGVRKLRPGESLLLDRVTWQYRLSTWWDIPLPGQSQAFRSAAEWEEAVDATVRQSVRRQLMADVPLGAFLSGGVDSSLVVSHMDDMPVFTIGFDDPSYSEVEWARRVARHLGREHRVEILRPRVVDLFEQLMWFMDDPIGDFSIFPTYLVSREASREVKVALTGDGGDELFGGYETYAAQERARIWRRIPAFLRHGWLEPAVQRLKPRPQKKGWVNKARRFVEGLQHEESLRHARWRLFVGDAMRRSLFTADAQMSLTTDVGAHIRELFEASGSRTDVDRGLYVDAKSYLSDNCLVKVDRMSMACSLEVRVPLLDPEVVKLAFQVPSGLKVAGGRTKPLLKQVAARHVPRECVYRPKEGFGIPMKRWLLDEFRPLLEEFLDAERLRKEGVFDVATIGRLKREHLEGSANHSHVLWTLLVFQDWRQRWGV